MPFFCSAMPFFPVPCLFSKATLNALHFGKKNHENQTKTREVIFFFSLKPKVAGKTPAVTIVYSAFILLQLSLTGGNFDTSFDDNKPICNYLK